MSILVKMRMEYHEALEHARGQMERVTKVSGGMENFTEKESGIILTAKYILVNMRMV